MPKARKKRTGKQTQSWADEPENWSVAMLLEKLQKCGIRVPASLKRAQLIQIYRDNIEENEVMPAATSGRPTTRQNSGMMDQEGSVTPPSGSGRARQHACAEVDELPTTSVQQTPMVNNDGGSLMEVLSGIQTSMSEMRKDINNLKARRTDNSGDHENNQVTGFHGFTAQSATSQGRVSSDSVPHVDVINPQLRTKIIQGKNVNLALLLMPYETVDSRQYESVDGCNKVVVLKSNTHDTRLLKSLSLGEFITAFTRYKNIIFEEFPDRRAELDMYERDIVEMAAFNTGSQAFYEYHKAFSARAAALLAQRNIKIDWSIRDTKLFTAIFAGQTIQKCEHCESLTHSSPFCPMSTTDGGQSSKRKPGLNKTRNESFNNTDIQGRLRITHRGKEICNNFNSQNGCNRSSCNLSHLCIECKFNNHSIVNCRRVQNTQFPANNSRREDKSTK